jgi:lysylphosphatidylglycerol synthetase-like protein (DUF2156 family)
MSSDLSTETQDFLITWGVTFAIAGLCFALIGIVVGWIIWKNTRKVTEEIEAGNRDALADYETTSDEVSKIRAELSGTTD